MSGRVLVACEFSGRVRDAFLSRGHDAISCDLLPTETPGPHQGDVRELLADGGGWDLVIAFPPCTDLAWSNGRHLLEKRVDGRTTAALELFEACLTANAPRVAVENPRGDPCHVWPEYQVVQPWEFGDPWVKTTCLWLRGLPPLMPRYAGTVDRPGLWVNTGGSDRRGRTRTRGEHRNSHSRSLTFEGIADAMAEQWGAALPDREVSA